MSRRDTHSEDQGRFTRNMKKNQRNHVQLDKSFKYKPEAIGLNRWFGPRFQGNHDFTVPSKPFGFGLNGVQRHPMHQNGCSTAPYAPERVLEFY